MTTAARLLAQLDARPCTATADAGRHLHTCKYLTTSTERTHPLHLCGCGDLFEDDPTMPEPAEPDRNPLQRDLILPLKTVPLRPLRAILDETPAPPGDAVPPLPTEQFTVILVTWPHGPTELLVLTGKWWTGLKHDDQQYEPHHLREGILGFEVLAQPPVGAGETGAGETVPKTLYDSLLADYMEQQRQHGGLRNPRPAGSQSGALVLNRRELQTVLGWYADSKSEGEAPWERALLDRIDASMPLPKAAEPKPDA